MRYFLNPGMGHMRSPTSFTRRYVRDVPSRGSEANRMKAISVAP